MRRLDRAKRAVVQVGGGRGFVVQNGIDRVVITAAHCLPLFPPCHGMSQLEERTYGALLGSNGPNPRLAIHLPGWLLPQQQKLQAKRMEAMRRRFARQ
jgi:hypothetical protein